MTYTMYNTRNTAVVPCILNHTIINVVLYIVTIVQMLYGIVLKLKFVYFKINANNINIVHTVANAFNII